MGNILHIDVNQTSLKHKSYIPYNELARTLFLAESTNNIKIKITHHRVIGDGCIWEVISLMKADCVTQSVFYQVLNAISDGVFNGEIMFNIKRIMKRLCHYK